MAGLTNVPERLRREPRWVCWRLQRRDGRATKLPVDPRTGRMASSTDPGTWGTFDEAASAVGRWHASGVGFVFGPDRAFTGLDLDHVIREGRLADAYRWVVSESGTYCEVSPSGEGLHLIFAGPKPEGATRCRRGPVEMYDHDRFFTVTGDAYGGARDVAPNPRVVERAYRTWIDPGYGGGQATVPVAAPTGPSGGDDATGALSDDELMRRAYASASGPAIRALMAGDTSAQGGDHSAADMALCSHLAFWLGGDAARIDRVFRSSGLMRDKWDSRRGGSTYGEQTVARAIEGCREHYAPGRGRDGRKAKSGDAREAAREETDEPAFDPDRAPSVEGWQVMRDGSLWAVDGERRPRYSVTATAPWIACDLVDVDSGEVRALVRVAAPGGVRERAMDRGTLLNQSKVIGALAPMGANVSSSNCKDVVRYLTDCERRLVRVRPRMRSVRHLGWADGPLGAFMPYDAGSADVRFDPSPDELAKSRPFAEPAGTLAEWVAGVAPVREASPAFRCVLAASFASPLVGILGVQTFIVYLWGRSRSGKTPTLKAAGSVWGDPTEGSDSYFRTFADTPKSIVRAAALLHDVPVIVDELQSKGAPGGQGAKRQMVEDLLYSLSIGHERGALNADRTMMRAGSWHSITIATGEIPIVGEATQQGAANRTLELNAEPFSDVRRAQAMHHLVSAQHGTAGRTYVRYLRGNTVEWYASQFSALRSRVCALAAGHPQADNVALLAFADALASFYVFGGGAWETCVEGGVGLARWALAHSTGAAEGDTDLKAIQFVSEWLVQNVLHFEDSAEADRVDRWGVLESRQGVPGRVWCVFQSVLERALAQQNFDRQKTLRRMSDEGLLVTTGGGRRFTRQRRVRGGSRVWCVCIDGDRMEELLGRTAGGAASPASPVAAPVGDGGGDR